MSRSKRGARKPRWRGLRLCCLGGAAIGVAALSWITSTTTADDAPLPRKSVAEQATVSAPATTGGWTAHSGPISSRRQRSVGYSFAVSRGGKKAATQTAGSQPAAPPQLQPLRDAVSIEKRHLTASSPAATGAAGPQWVSRASRLQRATEVREGRIAPPITATVQPKQSATAPGLSDYEVRVPKRTLAAPALQEVSLDTVAKRALSVPQVGASIGQDATAPRAQTLQATPAADQRDAKTASSRRNSPPKPATPVPAASTKELVDVAKKSLPASTSATAGKKSSPLSLGALPGDDQLLRRMTREVANRPVARPYIGKSPVGTQESQPNVVPAKAADSSKPQADAKIATLETTTTLSARAVAASATKPVVENQLSAKKLAAVLQSKVPVAAKNESRAEMPLVKKPLTTVPTKTDLAQQHAPRPLAVSKSRPAKPHKKVPVTTVIPVAASADNDDYVDVPWAPRRRPQVTQQRVARLPSTNRLARDPLLSTIPSRYSTKSVRPQLNQLNGAAAPATADRPFEIIGQSGELAIQVRRSALLKTKFDIYRTAVVDASVCEIVQFTPREVSIIGRSQGATHVTLWVDDEDRDPVTYLVKVTPDELAVQEEQQEYQLLESLITDLFPDSKVYLQVVANKLIVRGQAKDSEEASQILSILRTHSGTVNGLNNQRFGSLNQGEAAAVINSRARGNANARSLQVINMLRIPGVQQVALRVKIAELTRTAGRGGGIEVDGEINLSSGSSRMFLQSLLATTNGTPSVLSQFDAQDIEVGLHYLQQQGVIRMLSEPTLVTLNGRAATFVAGGEFAVPTVVGSAGLNSVTTDFRAFGAILSFLPTVLDKDRVRLEISPEFSQIDNSLSVGGTPGLSVRAVSTTVEMREGQTLAIAGLLDESMNANQQGSIPFLWRLLGPRSVSRNETELIILVTPELVHPMEPGEVPPLPGFDVTEPNNVEFYLHGKLEGVPTREYRSTVWPALRERYRSDCSTMTSGPFGHSDK